MSGDTGSAPAGAAAHATAAAGVLVLALAWMQPEGGAGLGFLAGLLFHGLHIGLASAVAWWCSGALLRRATDRRASPWLWLVLAGALAGLVLAPVSLVLEALFGVVEPDRGPPSADWGAALLHEWTQVVPITALLWPLMALPLALQRPRPSAAAVAPLRLRAPDLSPAPARPPTPQWAPAEAVTPATPISAPPPAPTAPVTAPGTARPPPIPSFLDRLPSALGRDLVWLQAQEHYLAVTTTQGRHLMLQAFTPAVDELARLGIDGMQTHRSAWVAWAHVQRLDTRARSPAVVLQDGTRVALGRRRLPEVAAAWQARRAGTGAAVTIDSPAGDPA